ncbi:helix-turn-helix domain-containing protein [Chryseobacterium sp. Chry.R1]|uniref:helix-turn-helix domain-containing protein n=1 Tax=Chryseobacterium sp. Chry.R1 TaxID=3139392 RepID=UPI0031F7CD44
MKNQPNYKLIYSEMISEMYPENEKIFLPFFEKDELDMLDVIRIENLISRLNKNTGKEISGRHRSYDKKTILQILDFQKKNNYNNTELARHFKLSRNTIAKWKKLFLYY